MKYIKWLYLLESAFCLLFFYRSDGLAYWDGSEIKYTRDLFSSGSDDDVAIIVIGMIGLVGAILSFLNSSKKYLTIVVIAVAILQWSSQILIEVGSVFETLVFTRNIYLLGATTCYITIISLLFTSKKHT